MELEGDVAREERSYRSVSVKEPVKVIKTKAAGLLIQKASSGLIF